MTSKHKCISHPHDRALIAFGSVVLEILHDSERYCAYDHEEWSPDTPADIAEAAHNFGLADDNRRAEFVVLPRDKFENPLNL